MNAIKQLQTPFKPTMLALTLAGAFFSSASMAAPSAPNAAATASSLENQSIGEHHQKQRLAPTERKPRSAPQLNARQTYGVQDANRADLLKRPSRLTQNFSLAQAAKSKTVNGVATATCDVNLFANATGATLVNNVKASSTDCINDLFNVTGTTAGKVFNENQMVSIADALRSASGSYNGSNAGSVLQMVLFLRAGYYVNFYNSADTGTYGSRLKTSIEAAMDAFVNNGNFGLVNDVHGETLAEFVILVDSATENARYLNSVVKRLLNGYNSSYNNYWWMKSAVNNTFTVLFRGHQNADFKALVQSDSSIVDTLYNFVNNNFGLLGGDLDYLIANAGRETGRFLQYTEGSALKNLAKSRAKAMIDRSSVTGSTAALWVGVGEMIDYFDKANCSYYSLCDFVQRLETNVLPISYSCSPTLRLRAQALTNAQLSEACTIVGGEESYFHTQVASGKVPVANDNNTQLEMVVFKSSKDYGTYAGAIFGIDTNNGGMYLEGSPNVAGNQPRFIAYQAEWMLPKFEIWNLTHEYIHYLDGRFDMYGDFNAAMGVKSVWWIEGFAEYMSYSYRKLDYAGAKAEAAAGTYPLSTVFQNDYSSGQTRVYNWGYLAVRYMFEKQRSKVSSVLGYFRPGNYSGYATYMGSSSMGNSMDSGFKAWLPCVNDASLPGCGGTTPPTNVLPVAGFSNTASNLAVNFTDTSTDSDGTIASRLWNFGDNTPTSGSANPAHTYAAAGSYNVTLTVTDNSGGQASTSKTITVSNSSTNLPPTAKFVSAVSGMSATFTDQSTDSDGSIASRAWSFGDNTTATTANPVHTYATAGTFPVSLTVTDNKGAKATVSQNVVISGGSTFPECPGTAQALGKNCVRSNLSAALGEYAYLYLYVPAGTTQVRISSYGGSGNADMYGNTLGQWATRSAYNYGSFGSGNAESITINNPPTGYIYVSLYGQSAFSGATVKVEY